MTSAFVKLKVCAGFAESDASYIYVAAIDGLVFTIGNQGSLGVCNTYCGDFNRVILPDGASAGVFIDRLYSHLAIACGACPPYIDTTTWFTCADET